MNGLSENGTATAAKPARPPERGDRPRCWRCMGLTRVIDGVVVCDLCPVPFRVVFDGSRGANCHE